MNIKYFTLMNIEYLELRMLYSIFTIVFSSKHARHPTDFARILKYESLQLHSDFALFFKFPTFEYQEQNIQASDIQYNCVTIGWNQP